MSSFPPPGDSTAPPPGDSGQGSPGTPSSGSGQGDGWGAQQPSVRSGQSAAAAPGTVPLRPLGLGDMFDGAFRTIRRNPGATLGVAFAVNLVFLVVPVVGIAVLAALGELGPVVPDLSLEAEGSSAFPASTVVTGLLSAVASLLAGVVVTGLVVQVVARAAIGEKIRAGEAWRRTRPRLWALLGLTILTSLLPVVVAGLVVGAALVVGLLAGTALGVVTGVLLGLAATAGVVWFWTRYLLLAPCVLVLERSSIRTAARRSRELSRGSFWRLLGTYVLISVLAYLVATLAAIPLGVLSLVSVFALGDQTLGTLLVLTLDNFSTVVSGAIATPFIGAVVALQYLDVRMRREGLDVRLQQQAAQARTGSPGGSGTPGTPGR